MASDSETLPLPAESDLSTLTILANGAEIPQTLQVLGVSIEYEINRIPYAKILISDGDAAKQDFPASNQTMFAPGSEIDIQSGYHMEEASIFKGIVVRHGIRSTASGSLLTIICKDKAVKMSIGLNSRYSYDMTDSDIIEKLVSDNGLSADVETTSIKHKNMVQYQSTDWDFMLMRAEMNGKLVSVRDGKVTVKKPDPAASAVVTLAYGSTILEIEADMDAESQLGTVVTAGWDQSAQAEIKTEGADPAYPEQGNLTASDLANVVAPGEYRMHHDGWMTETELQAWSDFALAKSRLAKIRGRVRCQGMPDVTVGSVVKLEGVGERFSGNAWVSGVRHEITAGNWVMDVQLGLDPKWFNRRQDIVAPLAAGMLPAIHGLHIGVVSKLEGDPDGEERIQVCLPMIKAGEDGIWTRICSLDAGNNRGMVFRPEIGDEVIIGFLYGDPRQAVMLGMVNSSAKPSAIPASDDNHQKGYTSREGIKLLFDDEKKSCELSLPAGNRMKLDDDAKEIVIEDANGNKITMSSDGIALESAKDITLKATGDVKLEGVNITVKASAEFNADGGAGSKVTSSAMTTIKGSLVQIN